MLIFSIPRHIKRKPSVGAKLCTCMCVPNRANPLLISAVLITLTNNGQFHKLVAHPPEDMPIPKCYPGFKCQVKCMLHFFWGCRTNLWNKQGNFKGESAVVAILPSRMEARFCTSRFFHS